MPSFALRATEGCSILYLLAPLADKIGKIKRLYNMGR